MKLYRIIIPAYIQEIEAENEKEAITEFWERYDLAQSDYGWGEPTIKVINKKDTRNL